MTLRITAGSPELLGVTPDARGVNVAVFSRNATGIDLCLFEAAGERETERIRLVERTGDVFHAHVADVPPGARYGLRAHGPYDPTHGHRFNSAKLLVDPYAVRLDRPFRMHPSLLGYRPGDAAGDLSLNDDDSGPYVPKAIVTALASPKPAARTGTPWSATVIYELHVRGFTRRLAALPPPVRGTLAGLAHPAALGHLTALGVTCVELMPVAAWIDERHLVPLGLTNYWGYNPIAMLAPDPRLAPGGWPEVRAAVDAFHRAGLEVVLDIVLNHSGEGDEFGPTVSMRGLDNASYYRLPPDDRRHYVNDMGCGNTLALDDPAVARLALDTLRQWATQGGVDGFRFDLGTALGRNAGGFDPAAPLLAAIDRDPLLGTLKLISEPWDIGPGGYRLGGFPPAWGEWNDKYRDGVRRFWRGDAGFVGELATRLAGSADVFGGKRGPSRSIDYVSAHDGFTLADLVSHDRKHNEANGEQNRDGTDSNWSWNHGQEGPSADPAVVEARRRDQRNLLATLLASRGTPMLAMGSETGHSQAGNNNAYAQDNENSWLDWDGADAALTAFARELIAIRLAHPALRQDRFLTGAPVEEGGRPDVEWRGADGRPLRSEDWGDPRTATLAVTFSALADGELDRVTVVFHRGQEAIDVTLPEAGEGRIWTLLADTAAGTAPKTPVRNPLRLAARSVAVLAEADDPGRLRRPTGAAPFLLHRLAEAAGLMAEWWDLGGTRHVVSDDTKRVLLAGMGLAADTDRQARDSLGRLSDARHRRPVPQAVVAREARPVEVRLFADGARPGALRIEREDGGSEEFRLDDRNTREIASTAPDGRAGRAWAATLPAQLPGRHRLSCETTPDAVCWLTVAPERCYLPPELAQGARPYGVAAHLYTLRRVGDGGIGDFTTLARFGERAGAQGAVTVGLNPLHALFPTQRDRASPYHPSDRRFLDPIYLDPTALDGLETGTATRWFLATHAGDMATLSRAPAVDYPGVWALKAAALEHAFVAFEAAPDHPGMREFESFVIGGGEALRGFATFGAIAEARPTESWHAWPAGLRVATGPEVAAFAAAHRARVRFAMFLQFLCDRQLAAADRRARAGGLALGFYRDLAVGAAPDGAEAWAEADQLVRGAFVGSPPDPFSAEGQIWHLPPPNPLRLAETNFRSFIEPVAANMRHAGALRIDHVMGLTRLFVVPDGGKASDGTYLSYPVDDLLGQLALESARARCAVVGEDLGTVPDGFREKLAAADVLSYRVLWFERAGTGFRPPADYPPLSVACVSTHDLPTLVGWWAGEDIAERRRLGLLDDAAAAADLARRDDEKQVLMAALLEHRLIEAAPDRSGPLPPEVAAAVHGYLGEAASALVLAQADDLAGETSAVNLPGTDRERPNWRRKIGPTVDGLFDDGDARRMLGALAAGRSHAASVKN